MEKERFRVFPESVGWFPLIWMSYLLLPAYNLTKFSTMQMIVGYILLLIFAISYRNAYFATKHYALWVGIQLGILCYLSIFYSYLFLYMGFFPASFIGWYEKKKGFLVSYLILVGVMVITIVTHIDSLLSDNNLGHLLFFFIILVAPFGMRSIAEKSRLQEQLNEANKKIEQLIKQEERQRIARDLHDTLGHTLSLITLKSQLVEKLIDKDPERAKREVNEVQQTSRSALRQVRELVSEMRAIKVVEELIEVECILEAANISFTCRGDTSLSKVSLYKQNVISMCVKEAVTNVIKHSGATKCSIILEQITGQLAIHIQDNGRGVGETYQKGNGLHGMEERLSIIDGFVNISSIQGTLVTITVPIIEKQGETEVMG
ncbi:sensor histidine kinase [Priestia taiwanensis]|uniref:histidine kinase n=1 Tax=Priestia taiwanensis TaxID=1347902 RepID=A0A917ESA5_9BACI|nr:sensor histidine kinase [Priestia taiwanensis]MBM7364957.1 two-component system sensor histidine kinase DesK [Priestia taiwanensis]GGE82225.1 sensor histidine kinase [Priestia taiwanensis]